MIECPDCNRSGSLTDEEKSILFQPPEKWNVEIKCLSCNKFSKFSDSIIQALISENLFLEYSLISDISLSGTIELKIGTPYRVHLGQKVPMIHKIFLTCMSKLSHVATTPCDDSSFFIVSSEFDGHSIVGEKQKVSWNLYGSSAENNYHVWQSLLVSAKVELLNGQYNLSLMSSAIAFESFVDFHLRNVLLSQGMQEDAVTTILEEMPSVLKKVHKLVKQIDQINLKSNKELNKSWQLMVELRNKIAHGVKFDTTKSDAMDAFTTTVKGIFFFIMHTKLQPLMLQIQPKS